MQARFSLLGLMVLSLGCPQPPPEDMMPPAPPDMRKECEDNVGTKPVGDPCVNRFPARCECSGPKPTCVQELAFEEAVPLPGGYCGNRNCSISDRDSCGDSGQCVDADGSGNTYCLRKCGKKGTSTACRDEYSCLTVTIDPSNPNSRTANVCMPTEAYVQCDPTKDPATQCTNVGGTVIANLTNGAPAAACLRRGIDDVGECGFLPCQIGPDNCPMAGSTKLGCFYFQASVNWVGGRPEDKWKAPACVPTVATRLADGAMCSNVFQCGDNMWCDMQKCRQLCFNGVQPSYPGGQAMYKKNALPCPMGQTCTNIYNIPGPNWPGVCRPPMM